jgi:hypothetical protein
MDVNHELMAFADRLERATLDVLSEGYVSEDLVPALIPGFEFRVTSAEDIIDRIAGKL